MDKNLLESRLKERINKNFLFEFEGVKSEFVIHNFHIREGKPTVFTSEGPKDFIDIKECNSWINILKEIPGKPKVQISREQSLAPSERPSITSRHDEDFKYTPTIGSTVLGQCKDILMDNIKKLQGEDGAKFIPQAQEIKHNVSSVIDLAKTEIELIKVIKSH